MDRSERTGLNAAIDAIVAHRVAHGAFWAGFRAWVEAAVQQAFHTPLVLPIATAHASIIGPMLESYNRSAQHALAAGQLIRAPRLA